MIRPQTYTGMAGYRANHPHGIDELFVAVLCRFAGTAQAVPALLDTAAEWCMLRADLAEDLGYADTLDEGLLAMSTRFGLIRGRLERVTVIFAAEQGEDLPIDATCFISPDWPGPTVIGWKGCLERMRFALDPGDDSFCFADL